jgi:excisionase family DNA binding protein
MKDQVPFGNTDQQRGSGQVVLTVHQAATFLNIQLNTLYLKVSRGEIPAFFKGGKLLFLKNELKNNALKGNDNR